MPFLIAGLLLLWLVSVSLKSFMRASPAAMALLMRRIGGVAALLAACFMMLRGRFDIAIGLTALAFWMFKGRSLFGSWNARGAAAGQRRPRNRRVSRVRSAMIEMELDHATGAMAGSVLAGTDEGVALDDLSWTRCLSLFRRCLDDDPEGARLLEAYFDRRFSGWRQAGHERSDAGPSGSGPRRAGGTMSEDEAHEVLGLSKRASREEITRAHRALMKKLHPDHGGSTDLAARVNEAKDVLLRRHP